MKYWYRLRNWPIRTTKDSRYPVHDDCGDTLVEILITVMVVSITSIALLMGFSTSISGSAAHRTLVSNDVVLRTVSQGVYAQVEQQVDPLYQACATAYGTPTASTQFSAPLGYQVMVSVVQYWVSSTNQASGQWVSSLPSGWCSQTPIPATPQRLQITVTTPNQRTLSTDIVVNEPLAIVTTFDIVSISPPSAPPGASAQSILIYGNGFEAGVTGSFSNSNITIDSWSRNSSTSITASISVASSATTGNGTITLTNPDGTTASAGFTVTTAPIISSVNQSTFLPNSSNVTFDISGIGFSNPGATFSFLPAGTTAIQIVSVQSVSTTSIDSTISVDPNAIPGTYYVMVTNTDGQTSNHYPLTISMPVPSISSVQNSDGSTPCNIATSGASCYVAGGGFYAPVSVSIVPSAGNSNSCTPSVSMNVTSPTTMILTLTQPTNCSYSGYYDLTVIAAGGTSQPYIKAFSS